MAYHLQNPKTTFLKELFQRKSQAIPFLIYRAKWNLLPKIGYVSSYPLHVDIEVTNRCNLRCTMCVQHTKEGRKNQGDIDFGMACNILEAIGGHVYSVKFNWTGEPLLYHKLPELIAYAKKCEIPEVQINTNGILLTVDLSRKIIQAGLDRIIFSIDGNSSETYEKIRVGGKYKTLINNIHNFLQEKERQKTIFPIVRVQMCVGEENKHEVKDFISYWSGQNVQIGIIDRQNRTEQLNKPFTKTDLQPKIRCKQPWQRLTISWQGKVFPCCADWFQTSPLLWKILKQVPSDQLTKQFHEAWRGGKVITKVRKALWSGDIQNSLCIKCPFTISNGKH